MDKMFCIYDCKAEVYFRPFVAQSTGAAIRAFTDDVNNKKDPSPVALHPEDYTLFELGEWNDRSGVVTPLQTAKALVRGNDVEQKVADAIDIKRA